MEVPTANTVPTELLGVGLYSVPEAAKIARVPANTIRRWLYGYRYKYKNEIRRSGPVWAPQFSDALEGEPIVGFLDLIEVQLVHAFRSYGLPWSVIRDAALSAGEMFASGHPFASGRFQTDGQTVFLHVAEKTRKPKLLDMCRKQWVFRDVIRDGLRGSLDWIDQAQHSPARWWPLGRSKQIVLDPNRRFGAPIVAKHGISTSLLAAAYKTMKSEAEVADWYGITRKEVRDAIEFETQLAA